jgi:putative copper export protein
VSNLEFWRGIHWLHLIAMGFFVGGQLFLAAVVVPVERANPDRERLRAIARRFGAGTLVAIAVLIATGSAMASHQHRWDDGTLHVKLALVLVVGVLVVWHMRKPTWHALEGLIFVGSLAIVWLGVTLAH